MIYSAGRQLLVTSNANLGTAATWTQGGTGLPVLPGGGAILPPASALVVDPANADVAYLAFDGGATRPPSSVYKTIDRGTSWTAVSVGLPDASINGLAIDGSTTLYAASTAGVFLTTDAAATWQRACMGAMPSGTIVTAVSLQPGTKQIVAATYGSGVFTGVH